MSLTTHSALQNKISRTTQHLNDLLAVFDDMTSLNSRGLLGPLLNESNDRMLLGRSGTVRVTHDDAKETHLSVDLPGVEKSNVDLGYEDDVLSWSAHRDDETTALDGTKTRTVSDFSGMYRLSFVPTGVKASLENGVMNLVVAKPEPVADRSVKVALE